MTKLLLCLALFCGVLRAQTEPKETQLWTATDEVRGLVWHGKTLYAATGGGLVVWRQNAPGVQSRETFNRSDLWPSNEIFGLENRGGKIWVRFARHEGFIETEEWREAPPFSAPVLERKIGKTSVRATLEGLQIGDKTVPFPQNSRGTHISAIAPKISKNSISVALFGDGIWNWNGKTWRQTLKTPREITAWASDGRETFLGTRREGIFRREKSGRFFPLFGTQNAPKNTNIQWFAEFDGALFASTLDDGLIFRRGENWRQIAPPILSSSAPRQLLTWKNQLWVRHGGGIVDAFDGKKWQRNALRPPRAGVYALAGDEAKIYASGWGGWSEWDGEKWESHYDLPALKGVPILGIATQNEGEILWLATQSRGVFRWTRASGELRAFDERDGLQDDWITALLPTQNSVWAGTFVGGLARFDGEKWTHFPELSGQNVTAIVAFEHDVFVATRAGLWRIIGLSQAQKVEAPALEPEIQALWAGKNGVWAGGRTSLVFLPAP